MTSIAAIHDASNATLNCVVGLGGRCGDDQAGWRVIERLRDLLVGRVDVRLLVASTALDLLQVDDECTRLIIIDACQGLAAPGHTRRIRWPAAEIVRARSGVGHNVSLPQALQMAACLGQLPAECEMWCIEGCQFLLAQPLSAEVDAACERAAQQILEALEV